MNDGVDEGDIKGSIDTITIGQTETILKQMKKSICKITLPTKTGTGFFCKLEYKGTEIKTLITNYHVIDDKFIKSNKNVKIELNNQKIIKMININENKIIYSSKNKEYDIVIIKLGKEDDVEDIDYLEIDDNLLNTNSEYAYNDSSIYVLHYPLGKEAIVSYGYGITMKNYNIIHKCKTTFGSSGSPILNLSTNKVIGIHKSYAKGHNCNVGIFLKKPIIEMKKNLNRYFSKAQFNKNNNKREKKGEIRKVNSFIINYLDINNDNKKVINKDESPKDNTRRKYCVTPIKNSDTNTYDIKLKNINNVFNRDKSSRNYKINLAKNDNNKNDPLKKDNSIRNIIPNLNINDEIKKNNLALNIYNINNYKHIFGIYNTNPNTNKNNLNNNEKNKDNTTTNNIHRYNYNHNHRFHEIKYSNSQLNVLSQKNKSTKQNKIMNFNFVPSTPA